MVREVYTRGGWIARKGVECDKFYVVESGDVRWEAAAAGGGGGSGGVGGGGKGTTFGDLSLYHPSVTAHSVMAVSERVTVWCVEGSVVRHILSTAARTKHEQLHGWLSSLTVPDGGERGGRLSEDEMAVLLDRCELVRYEDGEWIVPSALARDHVFIVREGHVIAQRKSTEPTAVEPPTVKQRSAQRCAVDEQMPVDGGAGGSKQLFGVGAVFAADNLWFPSVSPTLPRRPSPIPLPVASAPSSPSLPSVSQRRKRGRDDSCSLSSSSLSTIYEHGAEVGKAHDMQQQQQRSDDFGGSGSNKHQRRQSSDTYELPGLPPKSLTRCVSSQPPLPLPPPLPQPLSSSSSSASASSPLTTLTRASSSPAIFPVSMPVSVGGLWVVCGSRECSVVCVPLDVLCLDGMERVRQWVQSRLVQ